MNVQYVKGNWLQVRLKEGLNRATVATTKKLGCCDVAVGRQLGGRPHGWRSMEWSAVRVSLLVSSINFSRHLVTATSFSFWIDRCCVIVVHTTLLIVYYCVVVVVNNNNRLVKMFKRRVNSRFAAAQVQVGAFYCCHYHHIICCWCCACVSVL